MPSENRQCQGRGNVGGQLIPDTSCSGWERFWSGHWCFPQWCSYGYRIMTVLSIKLPTLELNRIIYQGFGNLKQEEPKYGTNSVPWPLFSGHGTKTSKYGTSRKIRDAWQAYPQLCFTGSTKNKQFLFKKLWIMMGYNVFLYIVYNYSTYAKWEI